MSNASVINKLKGQRQIVDWRVVAQTNSGFTFHFIHIFFTSYLCTDYDIYISNHVIQYAY